MTSAREIEVTFEDAGVPPELAREVVAAFVEARRRFNLEDLRPQAVEGGRFSEGVGRVLEWASTGAYTPLSDSTYKVDATLRDMERTPKNSTPDALRIHIPRALRMIYDIRNRRNTAHLGDGIDPNIQDATLVVSTMSWVLSELVRLYHALSAQEAHAMIEALMTREVPLIDVINGFPRVLTDLGPGDHILVVLYWAGQRTIQKSDLYGWLPDRVKKSASRALQNLDARHLVHISKSDITLTRAGILEVEARGLLVVS